MHGIFFWRKKIVVSAIPGWTEMEKLLPPACVLGGGAQGDLALQLSDVLRNQLELVSVARVAGRAAPRMLLLLSASNQRVWHKLPAVRAALFDGHVRPNTCVIV